MPMWAMYLMVMSHFEIAASPLYFFATMNTFFVRLFAVLLPFALLGEFNELRNGFAPGIETTKPYCFIKGSKNKTLH